jgi:hypothetical protein
MTRAQTEQGVEVALKNLAKKSVRKACADAGISVTTLYNKTTPEQREAAIVGKFNGEQVAPKKRGRPARQKIEREERIDYKYVAKLQKALLDRILEEK